MSLYSIPFVALLALEPGDVHFQYHYGFDKDVVPTEWRKLEFSAQPSRLNGNEVWTARPARLVNSPFASVVVSLTTREAQPNLAENSESMPGITLADPAAGFPNG